ncbi:N-acyl homoserine lactonase family protein [Colwellia sp. D2M02]|uniref:N-acyl homoserine lactonase family protein n=1 Tax=Colwellia sp. D2M02 TaxID=2841562 RepID=UPI001C08EF61|nr:N-acyl homoserine lactonase family protein [Colwellia sp. D2M02]MBU2893832.1 N-acyl homoserine lactonase family protein [Colwellia sp. D2M02]
MKKLISKIITVSCVMLLSATVSAKTISIESLNAKSTVKIKLYVLDCGTIQARDMSLFNPLLSTRKPMNMAVPCYVIKHPTKGILVWDAGLQDDIAKSSHGVEAHQGVFHLTVKRTMLSQLKEIGGEPKNVTYFAPSHLHLDHSGNANYFTQSKLLMQNSDYQLAFSKDAAKYGFDVNHYFELKSAEHVPLNGDYDVFGDGSTIILSTPGHSPGHQSLYLKLVKTGDVILSGDLYHFAENRANYGIPVWNDKKQTIQSFAKIDHILDNTSASLWIQHDPEEAKLKNMSPNFYD